MFVSISCDTCVDESVNTYDNVFEQASVNESVIVIVNDGTYIIDSVNESIWVDVCDDLNVFVRVCVDVYTFVLVLVDIGIGTLV